MSKQDLYFVAYILIGDEVLWELICMYSTFKFPQIVCVSAELIVVFRYTQ